MFSQLFSLSYILYIIFIFFSLCSPVIYVKSTDLISAAFAQENVPYDAESNEGNQSIVIFFSILILITIAVVIRKVIKRPTKRRSFPLEIKSQVLRDQDRKCAICGRNKGLWDYNHIDGDRTNNDISNCQALCPDCHAKKSRGLIKVKRKSSTKRKAGAIFLTFIILAIIYLYHASQ